MFTKASDFIADAASKVAGDRENTHGDKLKNFENIAALWDAYLLIRDGGHEAPITADDVGAMMQLMKLARMHTGSYNQDDDLDNIGYAACLAEVRARRRDQL